MRIVAANPLKAPEIIRREEENKSLSTTNLESIKEMVMLDNMFLKLCALLGVGYGVAGAEIIAENMASGVGLNPMVPGKKMVRCSAVPGVLQRRECLGSISTVRHLSVCFKQGAAALFMTSNDTE